MLKIVAKVKMLRIMFCRKTKQTEITMDRNEAKTLSLLDKLADHLVVEADDLVGEVVAEAKDKRRAYRGKLRREIFKRDNGVCFYCSTKINEGERWHADHGDPVVNGQNPTISM